jgi:nitroimidazol reductase NimA-like FMN-containing flavoprotein (pyridoxamine 5'-phosphate oxidase superfamily)
MNSAPEEPRIEELSTEECYQRLATHSVGRVGVIVDSYPLIIPVNYVLVPDGAVIRTAPGSVIADADHAAVTLQVDEFDMGDRSGWSVLLRGRGQALHPDDTDELQSRTAAAGLKPWAPGDRQLWIRIIPDGISGRRIVPGELQWLLDNAAYL